MKALKSVVSPFPTITPHSVGRLSSEYYQLSRYHPYCGVMYPQPLRGWFTPLLSCSITMKIKVIDVRQPDQYIYTTPAMCTSRYNGDGYNGCNNDHLLLVGLKPFKYNMMCTTTKIIELMASTLHHNTSIILRYRSHHLNHPPYPTW